MPCVSLFKNITDLIPINKGDIISIAGAGGKTSLMFKLKEELLKNDFKVITTTTTRIFKPSENESKFISLIKDNCNFIDEINIMLKKFSHVSVGFSLSEKDNKLLGIEPKIVKRLKEETNADVIIIEADGSARLPFKFPNDLEPVIPEETKIYFVVIGIDAVYSPLNSNKIHRANLLKDILSLSEDSLLTPEIIVKSLTHSKGYFEKFPKFFKNILLINKVASKKEIEYSYHIAELIKFYERIENILIGELISR